jgi:type II secretory pathway predicted ATPase ExeA
MIEAYYGFKKYPFQKDLKTEHLFETADIREATARLSYLRQYRGIMCLTGEPGAGKTSIVRQFVYSLNPQTYHHCYTPHTTVSKNDLYRQINQLLRLPQKMRKADLYAQIQNSILELYRHQGKITCIILDECQLMDHESLQELVLMTNFEIDSLLPFILLLVGQPSFRETLNRQIHEPLKQRISVRYHLTGVSLEETKGYVIAMLKLAGRKDPLFEENSFAIIHQLSFGLPRKINNLCLAALNMGMAEQRKIIDSDLILRVAPEV